MAKPSAAQRLQRTLQELFDSQRDDARLRDHLEGLARDQAFGGLTWFWGPILYRRSRARFRPLVFERFSEWAVDGNRWTLIRWSDHAAELEAWLADARTHRDVALVRKLLAWQLAGKRWGIDEARWNAAVVAAYRSAPTPAARAIALEEYQSWVALTEDAALALYQIDRAAKGFIERHLPRSFWRSDKRTPWPRLSAAAMAADEHEFAFVLYRVLTPISQWQADVVRLAGDERDPARLDEALERRHPSGEGLALAPAMVELLELRGREVMPYVRRHLRHAVGRWFGKPTAIVELAAQRRWWDLWTEAIRIAGDDKLFTEAVRSLVRDRQLAPDERRERLAALAGASREWNWPGLGIARIHDLDDTVAVELHAIEPDLVRGPFLAHVLPRWFSGRPRLLAAARAAGDDELVDRLASRYITRPRYDGAGRKADAVVDTADELAGVYEELRERDPIAFARRAANVLTYIPAHAIAGHDRLLRTNRLARLLFMRSFETFLAVPAAVADLVEAGDIHVQLLAYRVLGRDDPRARALAVANLDILVATLLRPLHRKTRLAAMGALVQAALGDADAAARVLARAHAAFALPDRRYPKEELVGLVGRVLAAHPHLRGPREQPRIFGLDEELAP